MIRFFFIGFLVVLKGNSIVIVNFIFLWEGGLFFWVGLSV